MKRHLRKILSLTFTSRADSSLMFVPLRAAVCRTIVSRVRLPSRSLATHALDKFNPILHDFTAELTQHQPKFSVPADRIHILSQPSEFYSMLLVSLGFHSISTRYQNHLGYDQKC